MLKYVVPPAAALAAVLSAAPASAQNSFVNTCSNYGFAYSGSSATLHATCLTSTNAPHDTSLTLTGIASIKGVLTDTHDGKPATFQTSCGSIKIFPSGPYVTLSATCKVSSNPDKFIETSIQLDNIGNKDGNLAYGD